VLDRIVVVHADLGRLEWSGTVDLVKQQDTISSLDSASRSYGMRSTLG